MPLLANISQMTKAQLIAKCRELDLGFDVRWTVAELRESIKEAIADDRHEQAKRSIRGMHRMSKEELSLLCTKLDIAHSPQATRDALKVLLQRWLRTHTTPKPDDVMDIGKYAGISYSKIYERFPQYVEWAIAEHAADHEMSAELQRFVHFCLSQMQGNSLDEEIDPVELEEVRQLREEEASKHKKMSGHRDVETDESGWDLTETKDHEARLASLEKKMDQILDLIKSQTELFNAAPTKTAGTSSGTKASASH